MPRLDRLQHNYNATTPNSPRPRAPGFRQRSAMDRVRRSLGHARLAGRGSRPSRRARHRRRRRHRRDLYASPKFGSAMCKWRKATLAGWLKSHSDGLTIINRQARADPRTPITNANSQFSLQQSWRRSGRARRPDRGASLLPVRPRNCRPASRNPTPATPTGGAMCFGILQQSRRAGRARRPHRGADLLPRQPGDQEHLSAIELRQRRASSAASRCRTRKDRRGATRAARSRCTSMRLPRQLGNQATPGAIRSRQLPACSANSRCPTKR